MVDTNTDPDPIDVVIPANDDAIRAIRLISGAMADAIIEGKQGHMSAGLPSAIVLVASLTNLTNLSFEETKSVSELTSVIAATLPSTKNLVLTNIMVVKLVLSLF